MHTSSGEFINFTNELGTSGKFLELERNGRLIPMSTAIRDRADLMHELAEVEGQLNACNDPDRLAEFALWCLGRKRNFGPRLRKLTARLEARKIELQTRLREVRELLSEQGQTIEWIVDSEVAQSLIPKAARASDPMLAMRNMIIDQNAEKSCRDICKVLDSVLARGGAVLPEFFVDTWTQDYSVRNFSHAYLHPKCRNRVQKMISARKAAAAIKS